MFLAPYSNDRPSHTSDRHVSTETHLISHHRTSSGDRDLQATLRKLDINGQCHRMKRRAGGSPPWHPYSSESESSCGQSPVAQGGISASRHGTMEPETEEWMRYARTSEPGGSSAQYTCIWPETRDGRTWHCGYSSKKHLVKRHVESKHLQIKCVYPVAISR